MTPRPSARTTTKAWTLPYQADSWLPLDGVKWWSRLGGQQESPQRGTSTVPTGTTWPAWDSNRVCPSQPCLLLKITSPNSEQEPLSFMTLIPVVSKDLTSLSQNITLWLSKNILRRPNRQHWKTWKKGVALENMQWKELSSLFTTSRSALYQLILRTIQLTRDHFPRQEERMSRGTSLKRRLWRDALGSTRAPGPGETREKDSGEDSGLQNPEKGPRLGWKPQFTDHSIKSSSKGIKILNIRLTD